MTTARTVRLSLLTALLATTCACAPARPDAATAAVAVNPVVAPIACAPTVVNGRIVIVATSDTVTWRVGYRDGDGWTSRLSATWAQWVEGVPFESDVGPGSLRVRRPTSGPALFIILELYDVDGVRVEQFVMPRVGTCTYVAHAGTLPIIFSPDAYWRARPQKGVSSSWSSSLD